MMAVCNTLALLSEFVPLYADVQSHPVISSQITSMEQDFNICSLGCQANSLIRYICVGWSGFEFP